MCGGQKQSPLIGVAYRRQKVPVKSRNRTIESTLGGTLHVAGIAATLQQKCSRCGSVLLTRGTGTEGLFPGPLPLGARVALSRIDGESVAWPYTEEPRIGVWESCA